MPRRYGEGSVYQRTDGRWVAVVLTRPGRHSCYGATRRAALQARAAWRAQAPAPSAVAAPTVAAYLTAWQASRAARWRPRTREHYAMLVRVHVLPGLGAVGLPDLTPARCRAWLAGLSAAGIGAATQHGVWRLLRTALRAAVRGVTVCPFDSLSVLVYLCASA